MTLSQPKTPEPIVTKFEWRDYLCIPSTKKNLCLIRPGVFAPHTGEKYAPPVRNLLHFFGSSTRLQASPLDRFLRLIRQMTRLIFDLFIRKILTKIIMAPMGKI